MASNQVRVTRTLRNKAEAEAGRKIYRPDDFDFLELKVYDIHGYAKGRLVSPAHIPNVFEKGTGMPPNICFNGVKGQGNMHPSLWEPFGHRNCRLVPIEGTLRPCLHAVAGGRNVASAHCELIHFDGTIEASSPRHTAERLLKQLSSEFGLSLKSSFEAEFGIIDSKTGQPLDDSMNFGGVAVVQLNQDILLDLVEAMEGIGVKIETVMQEFGHGQFEMTFAVVEGIEIADMVADFKTGAYVHLQKKGLNAEFMTCVHSGNRNGFHYNLSLYDSQGRNVFANPDDPKSLSEFGCHWLAGMIEHASAMVALTSPTINCYRRIGYDWAPEFANWSRENRLCTFRLKCETEGNVYIENRLPSSACNPYLVLSATLAAGMDGVRRKLDLPQPMDKNRKLPSSLDESLAALEADTIMKEFIGEKLVNMYIYTKRTFEVEEFKAFQSLTEEERMLKEKEYYYRPY